MLTLVSARTGVAGSMPTVATTCLGCSEESRKSVTSPTRMPLNSTARADQQSGHGIVEADLVDGAVLKAASAIQPVDEREAGGDDR